MIYYYYWKTSLPQYAYNDDYRAQALLTLNPLVKDEDVQVGEFLKLSTYNFVIFIWLCLEEYNYEYNQHHEIF